MQAIGRGGKMFPGRDALGLNGTAACEVFIFLVHL